MKWVVLRFLEDFIGVHPRSSAEKEV